MNDFNMKPRLLHGSPFELSVINARLQRPAAPTREEEVPGLWVFAQPDETIACGYALKTKAAFTAGCIDGWCYTVITTEGSHDWKASLAQRQGQHGGFIYEVAADQFSKNPYAEEWMSARDQIVDPVKTRFVSMEDCMKAGVQIFVVNNIKKYSAARSFWGKDPCRIITQGIKNGGLNWLNKSTGTGDLNPIAPPVSRRDMFRPKPSQ